MKITFHIGAHRTDEDRLMRSLMHNSQRLAKQSIFVPGPSRYRSVLRDVSTRLRGEVANPETVDFLLDAILDTTEADHVVLSHESFICGPTAIFADGGYYVRAGLKCSWLRNCFPGHEIAFAIGIRNPATQIPAVYGRLSNVAPAEFLDGTDPLAARWSPAIASIAAENPGCPLIVWCNEDTPLIWPAVMREVSGHSPVTRLKGGFDILYQIMQPDGIKRMRGYLRSHPPESEVQRRRIIAAFLDKYALEDQVEEEVDFPDWTAAMVEAMTLAYEADIEAVRAIPGVTFVGP